MFLEEKTQLYGQGLLNQPQQTYTFPTIRTQLQTQQDETYLQFIKDQKQQIDLGKLKNQIWPEQTNFPTQQYLEHEHEESHSLFSKGLEEFQGYDQDPQLNTWHDQQLGYTQADIAGLQNLNFQRSHSQFIANQQFYPEENFSSGLYLPQENFPQDTTLSQQTQHLQGHFKNQVNKLSATKLQKEWQSEAKSIKIQGLSKDTYIQAIRPEITKLNLNIMKETFRKEQDSLFNNQSDIIIKLGTESEAINSIHIIYQIIYAKQIPDLHKIKVSRCLESILEKDDSDNNGSGESSDRNELSNDKLQIRNYLDQSLDQEEGEPQVEYYKEDEQIQKLQQYQTSPFIMPKIQGYESFTDKIPMPFKIEQQRAFTPLDQKTTGLSEGEDTLKNLSGFHSFTHSNEAFQAFQNKNRFSSDDSGSILSAHANDPNQFSVQFRPSHIMQNHSQLRQSFPVFGSHHQQPFMNQLVHQQQLLLQQQLQQQQAMYQPYPQQMIVPNNQQQILENIQQQNQGYIINPQLFLAQRSVPMNDPGFQQQQQQMTRNLQFQQQQNSWPQQFHLQMAHHNLQINQQQLQNQFIQQQPQQNLSQNSEQFYPKSRAKPALADLKRQTQSYEMTQLIPSPLVQSQSAPITQDQDQQLAQQMQQLGLDEERKEDQKKDDEVYKQSFQEEFKDSFASTSTNREDKLKNEVDIGRIMEGEEKRTTIMIRNIPNKFKQMTLLEIMNQRHKGKYDYFYLPMDLKTQCNVGYAFINFIHPIYILDFFLEFQSREWQNTTNDCKSTKISKLAFANIQGKEELVQHHFDKNIMKKTEEQIKPLVLDSIQAPEREINQIKEKYQSLRRSGELEKKLARLSKKQKRATTTNGPHPHHPLTEQAQVNYQSSQYSGASSQPSSSSSFSQGIRSVTHQQSQFSRQQNLTYHQTYYGGRSHGVQQSYYSGGSTHKERGSKNYPQYSQGSRGAHSSRSSQQYYSSNQGKQSHYQQQPHYDHYQ